MVDLIQIVFIITAVFILFSIIMVLTVEKTMQSAYWLVLMLIGVSVLFLLANSEIIFAFQVSIYAGGISVLLLFAALLVQHDEHTFPKSILGFIETTWTQVVAFLLLAANLIIMVWVAVTDDLYPTESVLGDEKRTVEDAFTQTREFSELLWTQYGSVVPFVALLFLAALLGAVKLVIREWEIEDLNELMRSRYEFASQEVEL